MTPPPVLVLAAQTEPRQLEVLVRANDLSGRQQASRLFDDIPPGQLGEQYIR